MLCSVSGDKPTRSTWLDRLRSSIGISIAEDGDAAEAHISLDHFLRRKHHLELAGKPPTNGISDSFLNPSSREAVESLREENDAEKGSDRKWKGVMSDVLSELFNFGDTTRSSTIFGKSLTRKQPNPRHCSVSAPNNVPLINQKDLNCFPGCRESATTSDLNNEKDAPETRERRRRRRSILETDGVEEDDKGERDLTGFSRSDVTVIDTSFEIWRSEKIVFRRKNVWKARDKKCKSRIGSVIAKKNTKKRKCSGGDDEIAKNNKKEKLPTAIPNNKNLRTHNQDVYEDPGNDINRDNSSRLPTKPRKEGSSNISFHQLDHEETETWSEATEIPCEKAR